MSLKPGLGGGEEVNPFTKKTALNKGWKIHKKKGTSLKKEQLESLYNKTIEKLCIF